MAPAVLWGLRAVAGFVAVFGWALMLNAPLRPAMVAGVIGIVGNTVRLAMADSGIPDHVAVSPAAS